MKRWLIAGIVTEVTLLVWLMAAAPVFGGPAVPAGARPGSGGEPGRQIRSETAQPIPNFSQEISAAFTATPTTGTLSDAVEASRITFSTTETIEFNAVLFESGLAGTAANLRLHIFNQDGRLVTPTFFFTGVPAPADRTGFFMQLSPGSVPPGQLKWVMVISDSFGNLFVTPFQSVNVQ